MSFQIGLDTRALAKLVNTKKKKNGGDTNYILPSLVHLFNAENKIGLTPPPRNKKKCTLFFPLKS
jgi:hypothetical protein